MADLPKPSDRQLPTLNSIYDVFATTGSWPTFQFLATVIWSERPEDPVDLYIQLSELGVVHPALTPQTLQVRDETPVALTVRGLAEVKAAEADLGWLFACLRYLAERAREFRPPDPTVPATLEVSSDEVATALKLVEQEALLTRLGRLVEQVPSLWSAFHGPSADGWGLTVQVQEARRYAGVHTVEDYLRIAERAEGPPSAQSAAEPNASQASSPPAQRQQLRFATSVTADLATTEDLLGFQPLVKALHGLLNDASTVLPLAIAVTAPWGAGKSSVMLQLQAALADSPDGLAARRTWATVRFDAWKYERGERLWAALAKAIYTQSQLRMTRRQRVAFRARLEWRRRGALGSMLTLAWPSVVIAALVLAATSVRISGIGAVPVAAVAAAATLGTVKHYAQALTNPFKVAIERYAHRPDYEAELGFTAEADRDIEMLMRLIAPDDEHGLAVFVDDLDRCSSPHLVEIVEAMNQIFNSSSDHRCVFVLGLDRDVVTTNINVAYASTVAQLRKDGNVLGERFGLEFLAKLVQLSVAIPEPTAQALQALLEKVTGNTAARPDGGSAPLPEKDVERVQADIQSASGPTLASVGEAAAQIGQASDEVIAEAARREVAQRIEDSREVADAEFAALPHLERNPRQLKRFHNALRLQMYVANEDEKVPFDFTAGELVALAKWVVVRLRWPDLGNAIAQDPDLLSAIEAEANDEKPKLPRGPADPRRVAAVERWLERPGLRVLMNEADPSRRLSALELKGFLRVA